MKELFDLLVFFQKLKVKKFLHSEVNLLTQHIIMQDHDGQNNNKSVFSTCFKIIPISKLNKIKSKNYYIFTRFLFAKVGIS